MAYKRIAKTSKNGVRQSRTHNLKTGKTTKSHSYKTGGSNSSSPYTRTTYSYGSDGSRRVHITKKQGSGYIERKTNTIGKSYKQVNKALSIKPTKRVKTVKPPRIKIPKDPNFKNKTTSSSLKREEYISDPYQALVQSIGLILVGAVGLLLVFLFS